MIRSVGDFLSRTFALSSLEDAEAGQQELDARVEHRRLLIEEMKSCMQSRAALETAIQVLRRQNDSVRNETSKISLSLLPREKEAIASLLLAKVTATSDLEQSNLAFTATEKELSEATSATKRAESSASELAKQCGEVNKKIISLQSSVTLLRSQQREAQHQVTVLTEELNRLSASLPALTSRNSSLTNEAEGLEGKRKKIEQSLVSMKQQLHEARQAESNALVRIEKSRLQISLDEEEVRLATAATLTAATTAKELLTRCEELEEEEVRLSLWKKTINTASMSSVAAAATAASAASAASALPPPIPSSSASPLPPPPPPPPASSHLHPLHILFEGGPGRM